MLELKKSQEYLERLRSTKPSYTEAPILYGSCVILFDMQIPYQDGEFILRMLEVAKAWGIKQGVSGGDFFNQAAFSFFQYPPEEKIWKPEAEKASEISRVLVTYIPEWLMLLGNHDANIIKALAHQIGHEDLLTLARIDNGFKGTDYYWCLVKDRHGNKWRISHPRNISVIPARVPQFLADKYEQNIIAGHGHLAGCTPNKSGTRLCIDAGVCCDPTKLDYSEIRDSTRPRMNQGAVILKEVAGTIYPYLIQPGWTDWDALKRMYSDL